MSTRDTSTHVLVPMDYSELSKKALRSALSLHPDADVTVLHVIDFRTSDLGSGGWGNTPDDWDDWLGEARAHAGRLFEEAEAIADEYDAEIETETVVGEDSRSILDFVDAHDVDVIVMGSHGRSLPSRILLGSTSDSVVRRAPVPVMIVR